MAKRADQRSARRHSSAAAAAKRSGQRDRTRPGLWDRVVTAYRGAPSTPQRTRGGGASRPGLWSRATKVILAAGGLATAITAILSLLPSDSPDPENAARFTEVRVTPGVPLSEYEQRNDGMSPAGGGDDEDGLPESPTPSGAGPVEEAAGAAHGRTAIAGAQPATTVPPPSSERSPSTTRPSSTTQRATTSSSRPPSSTTPSPGTDATPDTTSPAEESLQLGPLQQTETGGFVVAPATDEARAAAASRPGEPATPVSSQALQMAVTEAHTATGCEERGSCDAVDMATAANSISVDGRPIPPDQAADRVVSLLAAARRTEAGDDPVGVVVATDLELAGLHGETIFLTWQMWQEDGQTRLHEDWLNENLAFRLEPESELDTRALDLWVPLPPEPGAYFVRVVLARGDRPLDSADSEPFA